jgi:hypothetical protein
LVHRHAELKPCSDSAPNLINRYARAEPVQFFAAHDKTHTGGDANGHAAWIRGANCVHDSDERWLRVCAE